MPRAVAARRHRRKAFTLVELLVVIGIIAVLISILIPTLARAREAGYRTQCLSNLRTVYTMMKIYEVQYKGVVPLGIGAASSGTMFNANNYFIGRTTNTNPSPGTNIRYVGIGFLLPANIMKEGEGRIYYCPVFETSIDHGFNVPDNPWPPSKNTYTTSGPRAAISQRPFGPFTAVGNGGVMIQQYGWSAGGSWGCWTQTRTYADASVLTNSPNTVDPVVTPSAPVADQPWPKLAKYKSAAILSDINSSDTRLVIAHKKGINVLYANGGAKFVDAKLIIKDMDSKLPGGQFSAAGSKYQDGLWYKLDQY